MSLEGWASLLGGVASAVGVGAGILSGNSNTNRADDLSDNYMDMTNQSSAMAQDQWNLWKEKYLPLEEKRIDVSMSDIDKMEEYKPKYWDELERNLTMFRGIEDSIVKDAEDGVDGAELADRASADVHQSFDKARKAEGRSLTRMGVNPNSGKYAAFSNREKQNRALAEVGARTQAHRDADSMTDAKRRAAMTMKLGLPMPTPTNANGSNTLNQAMMGMQSSAANLGSAANSAAETAAQDFGAAAYLSGKLTAPASQGGVDWDKAGSAWSSIWN